MDIRRMIEMKRDFLHDSMYGNQYQYDYSYDYDTALEDDNNEMMDAAIEGYDDTTRYLFGEQYKNNVIFEEMILTAKNVNEFEIVEEALLDSLQDMKDKVIKTIKNLWERFRDWLMRIIDSIKDLFNYNVPETSSNLPATTGGANSPSTQSGGGSSRGGGGGNLALPSPSGSGGSASGGGSSSGGGQKSASGSSDTKRLGAPSGGGGSASGSSSSGGSRPAPGAKRLGAPGKNEVGKTAASGAKSEQPKAEEKKSNTEAPKKEQNVSKKKMSKADFKALKSRVIEKYREKQDTFEYKGYTYYNESREFLNTMKKCADISDLMSKFKNKDADLSRMDYFDKVQGIIGGDPKDRGDDGYVQNWIISKIRNNKIEQHKLKDMPLGLLTKYGMEEAEILSQCDELLKTYKSLFTDVETTINNCEDAKRVKVMTRLCSQATKFGTFCIGTFTREYKGAIKTCSSIIRRIIV